MQIHTIFGARVQPLQLITADAVGLMSRNLRFSLVGTDENGIIGIGVFINYIVEKYGTSLQKEINIWTHECVWADKYVLNYENTNQPYATDIKLRTNCLLFLIAVKKQTVHPFALLF